MILTFNINTLPHYSQIPEQGLTKHTDSRVVDQLIDYQDKWYDLKYRIELTYTRWFDNPKNEPKEDFTEVEEVHIELLKVVPEVSDREFNRIQRYLQDNLVVE